jgi:uncharacterized membrane protein YbhN (UPF0104 family)
MDTPRSSMNRQGYIQIALFAVGVLVLAYVIAGSGILDQYHVIATVQVPLLLVAIVFSIANIGTKIVRWRYLSSAFGKEISWKDASTVTISSFFFANITPGKVGDLFKAYFMKRVHGLPLIDGVSMIFYERFFELVILFCTASLIAFTALEQTTLLVLEITLILLAGLLFVYFRLEIVIRILQRILVKIPVVEISAEAGVKIGRLPPVKILAVFLISLLSLVFEFLRLGIVARAFGFMIAPLDAATSFSLSIIAGLVSQIPLGVGITAGSLSYLLRADGCPPVTAMAIVLTDRLISMYFALGIGLVVSKFALDRLKKAES